MQNEQEHKRTEGLVAIINKLLVVIAVLVISIVAMPCHLFYFIKANRTNQQPKYKVQQLLLSQ